MQARRTLQKAGPAQAGPHVHERDSKVQLHRELHDARIPRRVNGVEQRASEAGGGAADRVGVVEGVEAFQPELTSEGLGELDVLK